MVVNVCIETEIVIKTILHKVRKSTESQNFIPCSEVLNGQHWTFHCYTFKLGHNGGDFHDVLYLMHPVRDFYISVHSFSFKYKYTEC